MDLVKLKDANGTPIPAGNIFFIFLLFLVQGICAALAAPIPAGNSTLKSQDSYINA